ncbi:hypothetical protein PIB30_009104 [Stylosanthes scabra]|uniref:Uncharacterized protein n=1 Tax=Stylosanthes scabra TaxID=79078 RepID=A0ABU6W355_9FABA|nr:hypothetical protein [Stylosanthes scabra]
MLVFLSRGQPSSLYSLYSLPVVVVDLNSCTTLCPSRLVSIKALLILRDSSRSSPAGAARFSLNEKRQRSPASKRRDSSGQQVQSSPAQIPTQLCFRSRRLPFRIKGHDQ